MRAPQRYLRTVLGAMIALAAVLPIAASAQRSRGTAVVYPVVFLNDSGTKGSRATAMDSVRDALLKGGFTLASDTVAAQTWDELGYPTPTGGMAPTQAQIIRFGDKMGVRYVVSPVINFHSRSIWVDLGPKTISTATVSIRITDVESGSIAYERSNVQGRSDEKFSAIKAAADVLVTPLVSVVSGGPKTPHEQRAVQIAVARALHAWVQPGRK